MLLRLLAEAAAPVSGFGLTESLNRRGERIAPSAVFRALRQLVATGKVRKIFAAHGYAIARPGDQVSLFCPQCGELSATDCEATFEGLRRLAAANRFTVSHACVEVAGTCAQCRRAQDAV